MSTLRLNPREKQLKGLLVDVAAYIDKSGEAKKFAEPVTLRWAGGWVRDKVLGIDSHDIDTAINSMTGEAFARKLGEFCELEENVAKHDIGPQDIGNLHKIEKNPEKSKHLETTTIRLFGLDVDFVNLRKETYADDSRNPQMEFGTAEEDALRRDATVNALFYNLHTSEIEDFTGGLRDMEAKVMRTPMQPLQTFMDDPLRVLRLVRFASRLSFGIDVAAEKAMVDGQVLQALRLKISRERVGDELTKMLKGEHPCNSLRLINRLGLYHTIFTDPTKAQMPQPDISGWSAAYECLDEMAVKSTPGSIYDVLVKGDDAPYFAWILASIIPWVQIPDAPAPKAGGKRPLPLATKAAREGFKAANKLSDVITGSSRHRVDILKLKDVVCNKEPCMNERDRFGMAIIEWEAKGGYWRLQVLAALLYDVMVRQNATGEKPDADEILSEWRKFLGHLQELDVMDAPSTKRLVDGKTLSKELGVKPGPWMMEAMNVCLAWQLRHPGETNTADAVEEVRKRKEELRIPGLKA